MFIMVHASSITFLFLLYYILFINYYVFGVCFGAFLARQSVLSHAPCFSDWSVNHIVNTILYSIIKCGVCLTPQTKSNIKCDQKQDGTLANFQKRSQVFLYFPELRFPRMLYSAHIIDPHIMENQYDTLANFQKCSEDYHGRSPYFI